MDDVDDKPIVFYDGSCALCNGLVRWLVEHDRRARLLFAPQQGMTFRKVFTAEQIATFPDSVIVLTPDGRALLRTATTVYMLNALGGAWRVLAGLVWFVPRPLRDAGYDFVQQRRKKWYGETDGSCPVASAELRRRFLE